MGIPTIKDVAKKAGVSTATVSRVINGVDYFSPEIALKVKQAIQELNYRPNAIARSLKHDRTHTIGLIVSDIANPFFMWTARILESVVSESNYNVIVCSTEENPEKELKYLRMLSEKRVDGLVLSTTGQNNKYIKELTSAGMPVVLIDRKNDELDDLDLIMDDNFTGGYLLTRHLIQKGHRRIALLKGHPMSITSEERARGYFAALAEANLEIKDEYIFTGGRSGEQAQKITAEILKMASRPTAIFAVNNLIAKGVIMAINQAGKRIPDDIALVCYGLDEFKILFKPSITCIVQKPILMGTKAGEMILKRIAQKNSKRSEIIFSPELFDGESV